ncbi:hypothetical protein [Haloarcula litorea]|uniref:hypothetical protein n=1 Tax=Haloarcula litorea TaxID=3032579 RepID=UPI0023E8C6EF|nr:hypothetical protein [Halomicroarcula sp. GDY20]
MSIVVAVLQFGGAMPLIAGLLVLFAAAIGVYAVRDGAEYHDTASLGDDEVVCPRCRHATDATDAVCPECGKEL